MIKQYVIIALRSLKRQKGLALINILGLSIGLACFTLFLLYAVNEFSFDRFHANASRIYRVYNWWTFEDRNGNEPASATPIGPAMKQDLPDVENFVRIKPGREQIIRVGEKVLRMDVSYADPQLFSVFTFPFIMGNAGNALETPNHIVLTREKANQLFGSTHVVGKIIEIKTFDRFEPFVVGAVAEDIPINSTIRFDILGNLKYILNSDFGKPSNNDWNMTIGLSVYVELREGSHLMNEPERLAEFRKKYFPDESATLRKDGRWDGKGSLPNGYGLQPLTDVHTNATIDPWEATDAKNSWILISIATGVLLIACINFITLAIGRSAGRSKEVGVRKVTGSLRHQLIKQFLTESLLLSIFSALLGIALAYLSLPLFNELSEKTLIFSFKLYPEMGVLLSGITLLVGFISGIYPALVLSDFKPIDVLKNKTRLSGSNPFTKSLVSIQFIVSIGLIISVSIIMKQMSFMHSQHLGFDKENVVMVDAKQVDTKRIYPLLRQEMHSDSRILGIAGSAIGLGEGEGQMGGVYTFKDKEESVIEYPVDQDFIRVLGMKLIAGRSFNREISSDTIHSVIVNEALVKNILGTTPAEAVGMEFKSERNTDFKIIIGVVKNFNFEDLTKPVRSQLFIQEADFQPSFLFIRLHQGDPSKALTTLGSSWKRLVPDTPFKYSFLDEKFDAFYKKEKIWSNIIGWAGGISIFLACMGLFGLTSLVVTNRSKEIGIRKVNGAKVADVLVMLNQHFVKGVILAFVVATPVSWYIMHTWLESFAYRTSLSWWIFALSGALALGIALLTVSWQSWKAATRNPVEALRYE